MLNGMAQNASLQGRPATMAEAAHEDVSGVRPPTRGESLADLLIASARAHFRNRIDNGYVSTQDAAALAGARQDVVNAIDQAGMGATTAAMVR